MNRKLNDIKEKLGKYINGVKGETVLVFFVLMILTGSLSLNLYKNIVSAKSNYEAYLYEKNALDKLQNKNDTLKADLEYYNSDEYKKLFLRESKALGSADETLIKVKDRPVYFEETKTYLDLTPKTQYLDWWDLLLK